MSSTCGYDWCIDGAPGHKEHTWTDGVIGNDSLEQPTRRAYVWTSIQEGFAEPVLIGIENPDPDDDRYGAEAYLDIESAEYLRDALTTAINHAKQAADSKYVI
jgi:hypothetical protein